MKKMLYVMGLGLIASSLWAACTGPFCYDDTGASISGGVAVGGAVRPYSQTVAQLTTSTAPLVGQMVFCSDCLAAGGKGTICISTSTSSPGAGSDFVLSTGTQCK